MKTETELSKLVRSIADNYPADKDNLLKLAAEFDEAAAAFDNPKRILGSWARLRRAYCNLTGEDLV